MIRALAAHVCRLLATPFGIYLDMHAARLHALADEEFDDE